MIVVIDNYDSFTYNLVQLLGALGAEPVVFRNDEVGVAEVEALKPDRLLISPGPCTPKEAGVSMEMIRYFSGRVPVLGVCLGHQSIGQAFGGRVVGADRLMHGKTSMVSHDNRGVFTGLPNPFEAMRYHSLVVDESSLPDCLEVTARSETGELMGLRHKTLAVEGVQFHPESIASEYGLELLNNFMSLTKKNRELRK